MYRDDPTQCMPGDLVLAAKLEGWPEMTGRSVIAFQKFTGAQTRGRLVRKGKHIFDIGYEHIARCVYAHDREF